MQSSDLLSNLLYLTTVSLKARCGREQAAKLLRSAARELSKRPARRVAQRDFSAHAFFSPFNCTTICHIMSMRRPLAARKTARPPDYPSERRSHHNPADSDSDENKLHSVPPPRKTLMRGNTGRKVSHDLFVCTMILVVTCLFSTLR